MSIIDQQNIYSGKKKTNKEKDAYRRSFPISKGATKKGSNIDIFSEGKPYNEVQNSELKNLASGRELKTIRSKNPQNLRPPTINEFAKKTNATSK